MELYTGHRVIATLFLGDFFLQNLRPPLFQIFALVERARSRRPSRGVTGVLWGLCTARLEGRAGTRGGGLKVAARPGAGGLEVLTAACSGEAGGLPGVIPVP